MNADAVATYGLAGAFAIGAVLGALAAIRIARILVNLFERRRPPPDGE